MHEPVYKDAGMLTDREPPFKDAGMLTDRDPQLKDSATSPLSPLEAIKERKPLKSRIALKKPSSSQSKQHRKKLYDLSSV